MKRKYLIILIVLFLISSCFAKSKKIEYTSDTHSENLETINENKSIITFILNKDVKQNGNLIKKGTLAYQNKNDSFFADAESFHIFCNVKELNNIYDFNSDDLDIVNEKYEIPSFLYKTKWINKYYFDYVYNQNDDFIAKYEPYIKSLDEIDNRSEIKAGKTKKIKENLRLRKNDNLGSAVITTIKEGSQVKILETGEPEVIEDIYSFWVKVQIVNGSDRDGNSLKAGTCGWCFGGYLE